LTDAEAAFRVHKSDLSIRPVHHQVKERVEAHILVAFLAYTLWKMLEQWQRPWDLGDNPRKVSTRSAASRAPTSSFRPPTAGSCVCAAWSSRRRRSGSCWSASARPAPAAEDPEAAKM